MRSTSASVLPDFFLDAASELSFNSPIGPANYDFCFSHTRFPLLASLGEMRMFLSDPRLLKNSLRSASMLVTEDLPLIELVF